MTEAIYLEVSEKTEAAKKAGRQVSVSGMLKFLGVSRSKARRNIDQPLIIHSDRGSQYVAKEYKKATENMQRSYSKKAFPWDNACMESFHSIIKREWLNRFKIRDYRQAYRLIFEYLEAFYNTKRIHSHCSYMSPDEFERVYERTHTQAELLAG